MRKIILTLSALAVAVMPVAANAAAANSAPGLSVSKPVRAATPTARKSKLAGSGLIIVALAAVVVGGGLYLAIDGGDKSDSN
jgi:hypothetical protein